MNGSSERARTVTGAAADARIWFVTGFCVAASVAQGRRDTSEQDPTMVIAPDIEAQILRYHHAEKWRVGTIARQLHVHHSTVRRVLAQAGLPKAGPPPRPSQIDVYLPFIRQTLETFHESANFAVRLGRTRCQQLLPSQAGLERFGLSNGRSI